VLAHRFTSRRDVANRRSELRIQYLLGAYRTLADTAHRPLEEGTAGARAFEQGIAEVQLLGSSGQAQMAVDIARSMASDGGAAMDDLLLSLRDDLRGELELEPLGEAPVHLRVTNLTKKQVPDSPGATMAAGLDQKRPG
jgi:hypothetical protein